MNPQSSLAAAKAAAGSTRPSAFRHLVFDRGVRFAVGLAVAVAIPVAVLFYFQFRSLSALEDTSAVVLRQLSGDTAESLLNDIDEALKRPHIGMLLRSVQARLEPLDLAFVDPVFVQGLADSPFIEEAWVWSENAVEHPEGDVGERTEKFYVFDRDSLKAPPTRVDERFRESPARQALVLPKVLEVAAQRRAIVAFPLTVDGRPKYVQIQLRFRGPDRQRVSSFLGLHGRRQLSAFDLLPGPVEEAAGGRAAAGGLPAARALSCSMVTDRRSTDGRRRQCSSTNAPSR